MNAIEKLKKLYECTEGFTHPLSFESYVADVIEEVLDVYKQLKEFEHDK
jgi:hypothetical protein